MKFSECVEIVGSKPSRYQGIKQYVSTGSLDSDHIDENSIEEYAYDDRPSRADLVAEAGNVLFAKMAETKKTLVINNQNEKYLFSTGFFAVKPKKNVLTTECLYYLLNSNTFLSQKDKYSSGATQKAISNASLEKIIVNIPCFSKQEDIVKQLDKLSNIIKKTRKQLLNFDLLIKSRFIEMFGDPVINEKDWDLKTLPELGEFGRGVSKHRPRNAPELLGGKYPLIQTGDVANANLYITDYESTYSEEGFKQSKMWKAGTLCITIAATIAKTAILTFDSCFPDSVVGFTPNEKTNSLFINYWFSFFQKILEEQAPAVAQKNINLQVLSELKIITPPISLQNDFATFVQQIDKSKFEIWRYLKFCDIMKRIGFILYD